MLLVRRGQLLKGSAGTPPRHSATPITLANHSGILPSSSATTAPRCPIGSSGPSVVS